MRTARPTTSPSSHQGEADDFPPPVARVRLHHSPDADIVIFLAACPSCGHDAEWLEEREDTRLRVTVLCPHCP